MKVNTKLESLSRTIILSISTAKKAAELFKEREAMLREEAAKIAQEKAEEQLLKDLKPYLEKIPKAILEAGEKGLNVAYIYLPGSDFDPPFHGHKRRDHTPNPGTATDKLMKHLTNISISHRIVWVTTEDSGAYNEQYTYYHYKLEIQF